MTPTKHPQPVTFLGVWPVGMTPRLFTFSDGIDRVIKPRIEDLDTFNDSLFADHLVARLGELLGAPVATPHVVEIPAERIAFEPFLKYVLPGLTCATTYIADATAGDVDHVEENRERFGALNVLYAWAGVKDSTLLYADTSPHIVTSVGHGLSLGSRLWTRQTLERDAPAHLRETIVSEAVRSIADMMPALCTLVGIDDEQIAATVAAIPADLGRDADDRAAVVEYLIRRRGEILRSVNSF